MSVRLIGITKTQISIGNEQFDEISEAEQVIVFAARASNPSNQHNMKTASRLLKYCIENKHWSVFETASMTIEIETTKDIAQQIERHRSFTFQEFSTRYAKVTEFVTYPARRQDFKNRQNSIDDISKEDQEWFIQAQKEVQEFAMERYLKAVDEKQIAKECARSLLPLSLKVTLYMQGTIRSWIHYLQVRCEESAQKEHRDIAKQIKFIFGREMPNIAKALDWN